MKSQEKPISELINFSIINIDKPSGPTSFQTDEIIKRKLGLRKTSHFGTLDPKVTGVLPIALGRACKLSEFFMHRDKTYIGIMKINAEIGIEKLQEIINKNFIGKINQLPPKKSRVKRAVRVREIKKFRLIEKNEKDFLFLAEVEAGTYIRKLVHDLGEITEVGGAHMTELRRTQAGIFSENDKGFVNLYDFEKAVSEFERGNEQELRKILVPAEEAIKKIMPDIQLNESSLKQILTGKPLMKKDIIWNIPDSEIFAVFFGEKFIGIYKKTSEGDIVAKPEFVFN